MSKLVISCSEETELAIMQRNLIEDLDIDKAFFGEVIINKDKFLEVLKELGEDIPDDSNSLEYSLTLAS